MNIIDAECGHCGQAFRTTALYRRDNKIVCPECRAETPNLLGMAVVRAADLAMAEHRSKMAPLSATRYVARLPEDWQIEAGAAVRYVYENGSLPPMLAEIKARERASA